MVELIPHPDPLGLPVPPSILLALKVLGFVLHMIFMHLWLAGLPAALLLLYFRRRAAERLFTAMPFFMAFGINAGIVPLLFIQTLYPQFFYPATILQAWFWFLVIPLLIVAYYGVYLAAFDRFRLAAGLLASLLLLWIGLTFSASMTLLAAPERWPAIFLATSEAGAVHGMFLALPGEAFLRFLLMAGMACGTVGAFLAVDAQWFAQDSDDASGTRGIVMLLYGLGLVIYGTAASQYAPMVEDKLPVLWRILAGAGMPAATLLAMVYWRWAGKATGAALIAAQIFVISSNAIARQMVQSQDLKKWIDIEKIPVRGEWGSFLLFGLTLVIALGVLAWIAHLALRRPRPAA
ncbi:MAG: hypothetical protein HYY46_07385 [Deltaproteobacteria bacterium]|nr:hypothetical protein [Deltaproteobacteria bacterium]